MALTGKQRRHLRGLGHNLDPVVHIGKQGLDDGLIAAVDQALASHELVKIKVGHASPDDRHDAASRLASATRSDVAQILGGSILLYRPDPDEPRIKLPAGPAATGAAAAADADDDDDDDDAEG